MIPFARIVKYGNNIVPLPRIKKILAAANWCMILYETGDLYVRGQNSGQTFGDGSAQNTIYTGDWRLSTTGIKDVWSGAGTTFCTTMDNRVLSSGAIRGLTGGTASSTNIFTDRSSTFISAGLQPSDIIDMSVGPYDIFVLTATGAVYSGGTNFSGQHGVGNTTARVFGLNTNFVNVKKISSSTGQGGTCWYLDTSGNFYAAGDGSVGQILGTASSSVPKLISTGVIDYTASTNCFFITKSDGLYCAGSQFNGQLGDGVMSSNIGNVGRTSLYKLTQFTSPPSYIRNDLYMTVVRYNDTWYVTGNITKSGAGSNSMSSVFVVNNTEIPDTNSTKWVCGGNNSYVVSGSGALYGTGTYSATTDLLPGYTTAQYTFVPLSTSGIQ